MVGSRPMPTAPVYNFDEATGNREPDKDEAYQTIALPQFIDMMRETYEDWEEFMDDRPGLYRALMSEEDLEW